MARAPAPPFNLPPWQPGMAPPVPGPVFSQAFNALLVLCAVGCVLLGLNLRDTVKKIYDSDLGLDNEVLTRGTPGNADWLKSIQKTEGRHKGHHCTSTMKPVAASKKKGKKKKTQPADDDDDDDDELDGLEMASLKKPGKPKKSKSRH